MLENIPPEILFAWWGVFGSFGRIGLQMFRDGTFPENAPRTIGLLFLGVFGGVIGYNLGESVLATIALGFMASDVIENLLNKLAPDFLNGE